MSPLVQAAFYTHGLRGERGAQSSFVTQAHTHVRHRDDALSQPPLAPAGEQPSYPAGGAYTTGGGSSSSILGSLGGLSALGDLGRPDADVGGRLRVSMSECQREEWGCLGSRACTWVHVCGCGGRREVGSWMACAVWV